MDALTLFPYQEEGVQWMQSHFRCILADEPGLGKTVQVLALLDRCPGVKKVLIVCPSNVKSVWAKHAAHRSPAVLSGRGTGVVERDFVIINYDLLINWVGVLALIPWDAVVFDEAHYLKSILSKRSAAVFSKLMVANRLLFLTGTPMLSRPVELWPILYAIDRNLAGGHIEFTTKYCDGHNDRLGYWVDRGASNLPQLNELLSQVMLRRKKADVLPQLPKKIRSVIETDTPLNWASLEAEMGEDWRDQLKSLARSKKQPSQDVLARIRKRDGVAKAPWVVAYVKMRLAQDPNCKIIIAAHHTEVVDILFDAFEDQAVKLTGSSTKTQRTQAIALFQESYITRVFIGNIVAAGQGITLTAADRVVFAELGWVPGEIDQMECRHDRIGQTKPIWVDWIVSPESIDSIICPVLLQKMDKIDQVVDGKSGLEISRDTLAEAFKIFA